MRMVCIITVYVIKTNEKHKGWKLVGWKIGFAHPHQIVQEMANGQLLFF